MLDLERKEATKCNQCLQEGGDMGINGSLGCVRKKLTLVEEKKGTCCSLRGRIHKDEKLLSLITPGHNCRESRQKDDHKPSGGSELTTSAYLEQCCYQLRYSGAYTSFVTCRSTCSGYSSNMEVQSSVTQPILSSDEDQRKKLSNLRSCFDRLGSWLLFLAKLGSSRS